MLHTPQVLNLLNFVFRITVGLDIFNIVLHLTFYNIAFNKQLNFLILI